MGLTRAVAGDLWRLWSNRDFRRLWIGQTVSSVGDWLATFALLSLVWSKSNSAAAVAGLLVLRILPSTFSGAIASWISDRWDRKKILVYCDIIRGLLILWVAVVGALPFLYLLIFFMEFFTITYMATRDAALPNLVEPGEQLTMANSMTLGSAYGSIPISAAVFALLVVGQSPLLKGLERIFWFEQNRYSLAFLADAITFFFSATMITRIEGSFSQQGNDENRMERTGTGREEGVVGKMAEERKESLLSSIAYSFREPFMRALTAAIATGCLGGGGLFSVGVVYVREVLRGNDFQFGMLMALFGVGMLTGIVGLQFIARIRAKAAIFKAGLITAGGTLAWMSLITVMEVAYLAALLFGAAFSVIFLAGITLIQETINDENRGKAFAAFHSISRIFLLLGAVFSASLAGSVGEFHLDLGLFTLRVCGTTIAMFVSGILLASVSLIPVQGGASREGAGDEAREEGALDPRPGGWPH
jgi:MFS family permease